MKLDFENDYSNALKLNKDLIKNFIDVEAIRNRIPGGIKFNEKDNNLSIEQVKMIRNAMDLKAIRQMIKEDEYNYRRFCLTEDYPTSVYHDRIVKVINEFMKIWRCEQ